MIDSLDGGTITQLISAYLAGLLTVLTPCIYPIIPVTLSLFGATADLPRRKAILLSCCYVAGICATYTALGLVSAKAKILFGAALGNIWIASTMAIFFILVALYSIEVVRFSALGKVQNTFSRIGGRGYGGAFLMGAASGFVAAPCAGPILVGILALAAQSGSTLWSGVLLFTYALGFGTLFIVLGTFSNLLHKLPRPGAWMNAIKFIAAAALLAVAASLLRPFVPAWGLSGVSTTSLLGLLALALFVGRIAYLKNSAALKVGAALVAGIALVELVMPRAPSSHSEISWIDSLPAAKESAERSQSILMVDFFAEWCAACIELSTKTFPAPAVAQKLSEFTTAKLDFTTIDDEKQAILDSFRLVGLPAIVFLAPDGSEIPNSRITGFMPPEEFLSHLNAVQERWSKTKTKL